MSSAVDSMIVFTSPGERSGLSDLINPDSAATKGAEKDVPDLVKIVLPTVVLTCIPGPDTSMKKP